MKVALNFYASISPNVADRIDKKFHTVEVEEGTSVRDLLGLLRVPVDEAQIIVVNGIEAKADHILKDGDRLGIFPAVSGG